MMACPPWLGQPTQWSPTPPAHVIADVGIHLPRSRRDLRAVMAWSLTLCGSLLAAEWRVVVLGGWLVILVVNER